MYTIFKGGAEGKAQDKLNLYTYIKCICFLYVRMYPILYQQKPINPEKSSWTMVLLAYLPIDTEKPQLYSLVE